MFCVQELNLHIDNIEDRFGSFHPAFHPAVGKVALNGRDMQQQLMTMFPGAFNETTTSISSKEHPTPAELEEDNDERPMDQEEDDDSDTSIYSNKLVIDENELFMNGNMSSPELTTNTSVIEKETEENKTYEVSEDEIAEDSDETDNEQREEESVVENVTNAMSLTIDPEQRVQHATSDDEQSVLAEITVESSEAEASATTEESETNRKRQRSKKRLHDPKSDEEDSDEQPNKVRRIQFQDGVEIELSAYDNRPPESRSLLDMLNKVKELKGNLHRTRKNIDTMKKYIKKEKKVRRSLEDKRWRLLIEIMVKNSSSK